MTHVAAKNGRGVPKAWLIPAALLALILLGIPLGLFSRAIVIDLLAWWPAWVILGLLAFFARGRRLGRRGDPPV